MVQIPSITHGALSNPSQARKLGIPAAIARSDHPLRHNRHHKQVSVDSARWFIRGSGLTGKRKDDFLAVKAALLTARCYPTAAYPQLRVCSDFVNWLFHMDDISDEMNEHGIQHVAGDVMNALWHPETFVPITQVGRMAKDYWARLIVTAAPAAQQRFKESIEFFYQAVSQQATDRTSGIIPDAESYITLRRDTGGCKPCWALVEYAYHLSLPDEILEHPTIRDISDAASDLITLANDIFSYNAEQFKDDAHNMIMILMHHEKLELQPAADAVGDYFQRAADRFTAGRANLPSWGSEIDQQVEIYVEGIASLVFGCFNWSFESERYFGKFGSEVKRTHVITLTPRAP